jgi:putative transposase
MHHVAARANGEQLLFRESADRLRFLDELRDVIRKYDWRCSAYCLMGSHFHLILYTVKPTLSAGMGRLCAAYAQWFNWRYDRFGHLFAARFMSQHMTEDAHLLEAHRYIALNPVRAGRCTDPADWRWGSYRGIAGLEEPIGFLDVDSVHNLFDSAQAYRAFVLGSDPGSAGCDEAAERLGDAADGFFVALLGQADAVAVLAVRLDHTVDVLPRLPVRIRRLRHT